MSIKVIIMDVDGTLTNSEKIITPKTKEALLKAQEFAF
jgi:hydroxymethylpyrimidine pyrophosphatase-like HAD family hydrolase